jgi:hypothetical protein
VRRSGLLGRALAAEQLAKHFRQVRIMRRHLAARCQVVDHMWQCLGQHIAKCRGRCARLRRPALDLLPGKDLVDMVWRHWCVRPRPDPGLDLGPQPALHITVVLPPGRGENLCISLWTDSAGGLAPGPTTFCLKFGQ